MLPKFIKKGSKILLWIFGFVILLIIFLFIFIQTDLFNKYALEYTLNELNTSQQPRENKITAESIDGNILSGIKLNKGSVTVRGDTLLSFNYLEVKYDLWGLIDKRITLHHVVVSEPVIISSKIKAGDSLIWNFENLFTKGETDTTSSVFDWDVTVENLKIENGFIRVAGDTTKPDPRWKGKRSFMQFFDFNHADVSDLNLEMSAKYYHGFKSVSIKYLTFNTNSEFKLQKLQLDANINEKENTTELWNFDLITNKSDIKIYRLYAQDFNPFNEFIYEDLGSKDINASIDIKKFNFDDLTFFIPGLNFLDSIVAVKLEASGKYGDLNAENIRVQLPNSVINLKGKIINLQKPDSMYIDVEGKGITIDARDITSVYKDNITDYNHLGIINADLHYKGTFTNFNSDFTINSSAGFAEGTFNFNTESEVYSGYINTRALNLGRILKDNSLKSSLNLSAKFRGAGFELNKMSANVTYSLTGSRFGGYDIRSSGGVIHANRGNITLNIRHSSSMGSANVSGRLNISNINNPSYNLKGNVRSLNVAAITKNADENSNLNFAFNVNGRGISMDNINGIYKLDVSESRYGAYDIPSTPVDAEIHNSNSNGTINISTNMVDFNAKGSFKFGELVNAIIYNISQVQGQIAQSTGTESLLMDSTGMQSPLTSERDFSSGDLNFSYNLVTKDSIKLGRILRPFGVYFNGDASGEIKNTSGRFASVTKLDVKNFTYQDTVIIVKNLKSDFVFNNEYTSGINGINIELNAAADTLVFGANRFDSVLVNYNMQGSDAEISLKGGMDTSTSAVINGKLNFGSGSINTDLDTVFIDYGGYQIENRGNWIFSFEQADRIKFEKFDIKSRNAILNVNGEFSLKNESDLRIEGSNIKITDIADIINQADSSYIISAEDDIQGEVTKLFVSFKGTFDAPILTTEIQTNTLRYTETDIGMISAKMNYENNSADANITINNAEGKGNLTIKGTIPYQNPLSGDSLTVLEISSAPVNINLKANDFLLDYFSVLVSDAASLRGVLNADLSAKGNASDPALSGNLKITKGSYLLPLTGMNYSFYVDMSTDNYKLVLNKLMLYNEDDESRHIDLFGSLDFKNLEVTDIDLQASGDMVVLDKDVEQNDLEVYGYILAGIGTPPVKVHGSLDSLFITGQLMIREAKISSVPMQGSGYNAYDDNFIYREAGINARRDSIIFVMDSTKVGDSLKIVSAEDYKKINPFERYRYRIAEEVNETFVNLDMNVKTEKEIYASIDFNNITRNRLFGELRGDLDIKTENGKLKAYGTVDVLGDSYFRFYRDFKLKESNVKFDGDITNPVLNIRGTYASQKTTEQYGSVSTNEVEVVATITGNVNNLDMALRLYQDDSEISGSDAQADAITYLLFGRYASELSASERSSVASSLGASVGSMYASSYLSQSIREILPFIVDAQFNYTEGSVKDTDVELISDIGDARIKYGGKLLKDVKNFEIVVDYPLNKMLNLNLPETLMLEFAREEKKQTLSTTQNDMLTTEIKILYKIKF
jgi:hypothetical protein